MAASIRATLQEVSGESLSGLVGKLEDREPLMAGLAGYLESSTLRRFERQAGPGGHPWKPSIRARLSGGMTLRLSGGLMGSITSAHTNDQIEVGSNKIYAALMHFGGVIRAKGAGFLRMFVAGVGWRRPKEVTIPGRPYLGVDDDDQVEFGEIIRDYLQGRAAA